MKYEVFLPTGINICFLSSTNISDVAAAAAAFPEGGAALQPGGRRRGHWTEHWGKTQQKSQIQIQMQIQAQILILIEILGGETTRHYQQ